MHRTQKASSRFLTSLAIAGLTALMGLVATPLLLRWRGAEAFGACRALTDRYGQFKLLKN